MDAVQFDTLARSLTSPRSRRGALAAVVGSALGAAALTETEAKKKPCPPCKKRKKGKCKANLPDGTGCAGGSCQSGGCVATTTPPPPPPVCTPSCTNGRTCQAGVCVCPTGKKDCEGLCIPIAERCCYGESIYCYGNNMETCCYPPAICCFGVCCANTDGTSRCCNGKALCYSTEQPCPPA